MNSHDPQHLTADELDAFLTETSSPRVLSHLGTCPACAVMVEADARVVTALASLPYFDASPDLASRVLARIAREPRPAPAPMVATPRANAARRRAIGALVLSGGGIAAGFAWAAGHPAEALRWSGPALQQAGHALWLSVQTVAANATEQPWFASVRDSLGTPARALVIVAAAAGAYAVALTGLRRLMTEPATDARW